jgi:NAD(P)-dependent dehydrogenase (short-subunit alcohol dehydrogenase family)
VSEQPADRRSASERSDLRGRVAIITGGAGLLGPRHAHAIASAGGIPVVVDLTVQRAEAVAEQIRSAHGVAASAVAADITRPDAVEQMLETVLRTHGRVDILINNAANNPKVEDAADVAFSRLERFSLDQWNADLAVGLTGAFLCSQVVGRELARRGAGVIVNISSEYGMIAPDQRLYRQAGVPDDEQPVKPVTYSVVKAGIMGLTGYLATYWADRGVRCNTLTVGGVFNGQPDEFVSRAASRIPMGRMANPDEYEGAIVFLCSDASSFMTGANLVVDGGQTCW